MQFLSVIDMYVGGIHMEKDEEKILSRKRLEKWSKIFLVFLAVMWLCTIISKSIYVANLPRVNVQTPEKKYVEHVIKAEGIVISGGERAVNTIAGLRVSSIKVQEGDAVKEGDVLLEIDLEDLTSIISEKESELVKLQYHLADAQYNEVLNAQKKEIARLWAEEDYNNADRETAVTVERAQKALQEAQNDLNKHLGTAAPYTSDSDRQSAWDNYNNWKKKYYKLADQITAKEREIEALKEQISQLNTEKNASDAQSGKAFLAGNVDSEKEGSISDENGEEKESIVSGKEGEEKGSIVSDESEGEKEGLASDKEGGEKESTVPDGNGEDEDVQKKAELEEALQKANKELAALNDTLVKHERNTVSPPDYSAEESAYDAWQQNRATLEDAVEAAKQALEDANYARESTLRQKRRDLANAEANSAADSTAVLYELEISNLQADIAEFQAIKKQKGEIKAKNSGFVSKILIQVGGRTSDTAAVLLTDAEAPCQFKFGITKEQGKYMRLGDSFELKLNDKNGKTIEATVDYLSESASGGYDIICHLPEHTGQPGTSGTVHKAIQGESHNLTIPVEALYKEQEAYYIYTYNEKTGILGNEAYAEKIKVQVADQNERFAALESGTVSVDTQIITFSSDALKQGQSVRLAE